MIKITPTISIDEDELRESFVRASGPGGQNVNKVASAVQLRFDAAGSPNLPDWVKTKLLALAGQRATNDGEIVIFADRFRTQERNRDDARARLVELIAEAAHREKPRRPTRPTKASKERRLKGKAVRSGVKAMRRERPGEE
ncbi:MAG: aminoacyl-tRNA hydrolase [Methylobacteriaceae bacterium]|nr:aminoacyl-tRNA hydrolase [Methylobacteriaceae bacterium]